MTAQSYDHELSSSPLRIFIFDSSRLRSHLFFKYMSTHPNVTPIYHPYLTGAMFGREHVAQYFQHSAARVQEIETFEENFLGPDTYASNTEDYLEMLRAVERSGKIALTNEHWNCVFRVDVVLGLVRGEIVDVEGLGGNPTNLPDEILDSLTPVILIRNPILTINSVYRDALELSMQRPGDGDFWALVWNRPLRLLFDYFRARGRDVVVVDTEDILWRTEDVSAAICERLGLAPGGLRDRWDPTSMQEIGKMNMHVYTVTKNVHDSCGIERPNEKPPEPTVEGYFDTWTQKYGKEVAGQLKKYANDCLPDYWYMRQFKV